MYTHWPRELEPIWKFHWNMERYFLKPGDTFLILLGWGNEEAYLVCGHFALSCAALPCQEEETKKTPKKPQTHPPGPHRYNCITQKAKYILILFMSVRHMMFLCTQCTRTLEYSVFEYIFFVQQFIHIRILFLKYYTKMHNCWLYCSVILVYCLRRHKFETQYVLFTLLVNIG